MRGRPVMTQIRIIFRAFLIAAVLLSALLGYALRRLMGQGRSPQDRQRLRGDVMASAMEKLGATFIKFGQILSTRPDIVPPEYVQALQRLQDHVAQEPWSRMRDVLVQELGAERFARLKVDEAPVAAASVAQVHRAMLDGTQELALKIQRPAAEHQIQRDLAVLGFGARVVSLLPGLKLMSLPGAVETFGHSLSQQTDFTIEANNNLTFAKNFEGVEGISVPKLFPEFCTHRVLSMEFIHGARADQPEKVGGDRKLLAQRGADAILRMVFLHGFVHADMHPGNVFLTDDGRVVLIDLGMTAVIPPDLLRPWVEAFYALSQQDGPTLARLLYSYAPSVNIPDYATYEKELVEFFSQYYGRNLGDVEVSEVITGVLGLLRRHQIENDPVFTVVCIGVIVAEGIGKQLDPDLDIVTIAIPYLITALSSAPPAMKPLREPPKA